MIKINYTTYFIQRGILYSDISNKEIYILPIFKKRRSNFIYNKNFFYENWNDYEEIMIRIYHTIENIEIIQILNSNSNNLIVCNLKKYFKEYDNKNTALILIEETNSK